MTGFGLAKLDYKAFRPSVVPQGGAHLYIYVWGNAQHWAEDIYVLTGLQQDAR